MRRVALLVVLMTVVLLVNIVGFWGYYIFYAASPYDEVGIDLNSNMPPPLNTWGCAKLHARFPGTIAPYGCTWAFTPGRR